MQEKIEVKCNKQGAEALNAIMDLALKSGGLQAMNLVNALISGTKMMDIEASDTVSQIETVDQTNG